MLRGQQYRSIGRSRCATSTCKPLRSRLQIVCGNAVVSSMKGRPVFTLAEQHKVIPLLDPSEHGFQFSMAIEFVSHASATARNTAKTAKDILELQYVLSGGGYVVAQDGTAKPLRAGDFLVTTMGSSQLLSHDPEGKAGLAVLKFFMPLQLLAWSERTRAQHLKHETLSKLESWEGCPSTAYVSEVFVPEWQATANTDGGLGQATSFSWTEESRPLPVVCCPRNTSFSFTNNWVAPEFRWQTLWDQCLEFPNVGRDIVSSWLGSRTDNSQNVQVSSASPSPLSGSTHVSTMIPKALGIRANTIILKRPIEEFATYKLPNQTNQLAFMVDPRELDISLSLGLEVFEPGHRTPLHVHQKAHELFFCLSGEGDGYADGEHIKLRPGDLVVFPPGVEHGLDNNTSRKLYCLQMMLPNEDFVEFVQSGQFMGRLSAEDTCILVSVHC